MALPLFSLPDPKTAEEGGLDPLGLASVAERLAGTMVPGLAQRMARPRFVSLMCLGAVTSLDLELVAPDGTTPDIAFEWHAVLALAQVQDELRRVPGIAKARAALADHAPMTSRGYLKGPKIFGFHGVYKTFATSIGVLDDDLRLRWPGEQLVSAIERGADLPGFLAGDERAAGGRLRKRLRELILEALKTQQASPLRNGPVFEALAGRLRPDRMTKPEAAFYRERIADPSAGTRGEVFHLLDTEEARAFLGRTSERQFLRWLQGRASEPLRHTLIAIEGLEALAKPLQDAFDWIRFLSSDNPAAPVTARDFAARAGHLATVVRRAADALPSAIVHYARAAELDGVLAHFAATDTPEKLFDDVLSRHEAAQKRKPPNGKRSWFERTPDGGAVVRPMYRVSDPPVEADAGVHLYRTGSVMSFLADLQGAT